MNEILTYKFFNVKMPDDDSEDIIAANLSPLSSVAPLYTFTESRNNGQRAILNYREGQATLFVNQDAFSNVRAKIENATYLQIVHEFTTDAGAVLEKRVDHYHIYRARYQSNYDTRPSWFFDLTEDTAANILYKDGATLSKPTAKGGNVSLTTRATFNGAAIEGREYSSAQGGAIGDAQIVEAYGGVDVYVCAVLTPSKYAPQLFCSKVTRDDLQNYEYIREVVQRWAGLSSAAKVLETAFNPFASEGAKITVEASRCYILPAAFALESYMSDGFDIETGDGGVVLGRVLSPCVRSRILHDEGDVAKSDNGARIYTVGGVFTRHVFKPCEWHGAPSWVDDDDEYPQPFGRIEAIFGNTNIVLRLKVGNVITDITRDIEAPLYNNNGGKFAVTERQSNASALMASVTGGIVGGAGAVALAFTNPAGALLAGASTITNTIANVQAQRDAWRKGVSQPSSVTGDGDGLLAFAYALQTFGTSCVYMSSQAVTNANSMQTAAQKYGWTVDETIDAQTWDVWSGESNGRAFDFIAATEIDFPDLPKFERDYLRGRFARGLRIWYNYESYTG